jgi:hypothetical protein
MSTTSFSEPHSFSDAGFSRLVGALSGVVSLTVIVAVLMATGNSVSTDATSGLDLSAPAFKKAMMSTMQTPAVDRDVSFNGGAQ